MQQTLAVKPPDVSSARSGEVAIAYQLVGRGPMDVVFLRGITGDLLSTWEQPLLVRHVEGLASCARVITLDRGRADRSGPGSGPAASRPESGSSSQRLIPSAVPASSSSTRESRGSARPTTRGRRLRTNGGNSWPRCAPDGERETTSTNLPMNGPPR